MRNPASVVTDGAGPQMDRRYSGCPDAVVIKSPRESLGLGSERFELLPQ
jgi:hypothetical protein